jgi:VIT1/CCC1 family predicted Fe2+/Mn2+ transporter
MTISVILFPLSTAIVVSLIWGLSILTLLSYVIAKSQNELPWKIVGEHLVIAIAVIVITHWVGDWLGELGA